MPGQVPAQGEFKGTTAGHCAKRDGRRLCRQERAVFLSFGHNAIETQPVTMIGQEACATKDGHQRS